MEKHEDSQVHGEPARGVIAVDKLYKSLQHQWSRPFENDLTLDAVELGDDGPWQGELVAERIVGVLISLNAERLLATYPR